MIVLTSCSPSISFWWAHFQTQFKSWFPQDSHLRFSQGRCDSLKIEDPKILWFNVVKTIIKHPFGNGLYHIVMMIWGMVYYCFAHITIISSLKIAIHWDILGPSQCWTATHLLVRRPFRCEASCDSAETNDGVPSRCHVRKSVCGVYRFDPNYLLTVLVLKNGFVSQMLHVWNIYLHLGYVWGKCR